ncbi:MAG: hypothetical protein HC840_27520 [Leptolyngbyaceae cyanobacterium RM2_2_4]|nr:hypothetical protein [Leptolyngbyaceae cyanobacterium SM1_4_3]NJO52525.1 hypothetical protein [Leptolyngbyaceae cyanobacterium RM2_2_4]NJO66407.1 hypothetical protein [Leptolyngbyaceae cyanobacterium RM1_405_57]
MVFSYSLPSKISSSPRVTLWRRLRRIGAIALSGVQILPEREECFEAFKWLAQEVQQAKGEVLIMRVEQFEGLADQEIIEQFREARREEYAEIETQAKELEQAVKIMTEPDERAHIQESLEKLYKQHAEIGRIDFFDCPEGTQVIAHLNQIAQEVSPTKPLEIASTAIEHYRDKQWVTRPRPHVDRLACIWLIRQFINPDAVIRYAKEASPHEVAFDMDTGEFHHQGDLCTFEVMVKSFGLDYSGLQVLGQIVHEIDLRDGLYMQPQTAGVDALLRGWLLANFSDEALETHGVALFEGLYAALSQNAAKAPATTRHRSPKK